MSENEIKGARLLTLYKQHYLNKYLKPLEFQYSCWGYFDGMDITEVKRANSRLFRKKSKSAISDVWYQTAKQIQRQRGNASEQYIGMFRCAEEESEKCEEKFWREDTRKAFLAACFVQLSEGSEKGSVRQRIEQLSDDTVQILSYFTFDNADLILFLQSNSFAETTDRIQKIDQDPEVVYLHPICGVLEKTVQRMQEDSQPKDMAGNPVKNDPVRELRINIVGDAAKFEGKLKHLLDDTNAKYGLKNYEKSTFSYMTGHENYIYSLRDTDMYAVLSLLIPRGTLTHTNGIFGDCIYNMETQLVMKAEEFSRTQASAALENPREAAEKAEAENPREDAEKITAGVSIQVSEKGMKEKKLDEEGWCRKQLREYSRYMDAVWDKADEGLYSYYQSTIQTLNALVQFEKFNLSEDIFCIIYPAFELFTKQLLQANGNTLGIIKHSNREKVMKAMLDFLDAVNSIIYHAIHMDQVFLMIPGCSGTSFSIPTKLSMFYLWYLESISEILNDSENKYRFYLTPVMESKPCTYLADFGLPEGDRLICARVSQRSLYMPRALFMILTHEIAHYVGDRIREREERLRCVVRTLGFIVAEAIIPHWVETGTDKEVRKEFADFLLVKKREITRFAINQLADSIRAIRKEQGSDKIYHVSQIADILKIECARILADENGKLRDIITRIPAELDQMETGYENKAENAYRFSLEVQWCDKRRIMCLASGWCDVIIPALLREYQEVFADAAAIELAQFSQDDYCDAFNISEGCLVNEDEISQRDYNRREVILEVYFEKQEERKCIRTMGYELVEYWPCMDVVINNMKSYLIACQDGLKAQISHNKDLVRQIRDAKKIFSSQDCTCREIYSFIDAKAREYADKVRAELEK